MMIRIIVVMTVSLLLTVSLSSNDKYLQEQNEIVAGFDDVNVCGDADGDGSVNIGDLVYLNDYVVTHSVGDPPSLSDANEDGYGTINIADVAYISDYLFSMGPPPWCGTPAPYTPASQVGDTIRIGDPPYSYYPSSDTIAIPVYISNASTLRAFTITLDYTTTQISVISISNTSSVITPANLTYYHDPSLDKIQISWCEFMGGSFAPQTGGLFCTINAQVLEAGGENFTAFAQTDILPGGEFIFVANGIYEPFLVTGTPVVEPYEVVPSSDTADMYNVATADLDRDNYVDVIFTGNNTDSLFIAYGNSSDTLDEPVGYNLNINGAAIDINFVDKDTLLDILVRTETDVFLMTNEGSRNFTTTSIPLPLLPTPPGVANDTALPSISSGFFNNDYYLDMVISKDQILFGDGLGGFGSSLTLSFDLDAVDASDFNYDGHDDLAITFDDSAKIYLNDGNGNMTYSDAVKIAYRPYDITSIISNIDLNLDDNSDFVTLTGLSSGINDTSMLTIALGDGAGGILSSDTFTIAGSALNISVSDSDRDGILDIQLVNQTTRTLEIYYSDGLGGIGDSLSVDLGTGTELLQALTNIDIDRNGSIDFVVGGENESNITYAISDFPDEPILADEMVTTGYDNVTVKIINPLDLIISKNLQTVASSDYWQLFADTINEILDVQAYDYNLLYGTYKIIVKRKPGVGDEAVCGIGIGIDGSQQKIAFMDYQVPAVSDSFVFYFNMEETSSIQPASGFPTANPQPTLLWPSLGLKAPSQFHIQIDRLYDFSTPFVDNSSLTDTSFTVPIPLGLDSVYYWRYRTYEGGIWSEYSHPYALYIVDFVCGDINNDGSPMDISDLLFLVDFMFLPLGEAPEPPVPNAANLDGIEQVDISDLLMMVDYMFLPAGSVPTPTCISQ